MQKTPHGHALRAHPGHRATFRPGHCSGAAGMQLEGAGRTLNLALVEQVRRSAVDFEAAPEKIGQTETCPAGIASFGTGGWRYRQSAAVLTGP